jgi:hypothetical protein
MNKMKFLMAAFCVTTGSLFTACHDNEIDNNPDNQEVARTYRLTANANTAVSTDGTSRALVQDGSNPKLLKSAWLANDEVMAFVLADSARSTETEYSMIKSLQAGQGSIFKGEIKPRSGNLTTDDELCFFYPGVASKGTSRTITPVTRKKRSNTDYYHEPNDKITNRVELNMSEQDGTVETISKRFDFQWKKVNPSSVQGEDVNVSIGNMERVVSFWGLRFTDKNNQILTNIDSVYISNVKGTDVFNLGTGKYEELNPSDESQNIVITPPAGKKISSAGGKYTYVAMFPGTYKDVIIMVYVGNTCYMREYASLTFDANKIYHSDLLQMQEPQREPYVTVQGIKWATGNFIHYGPENGGYWGIAPTQWWISRRAVMLGSNRKEVSSGGTLTTSQFEDTPVQTTDDVDLFRYGAIEDALQLNRADYKAKNTDIAKKFWNNDRPLITHEVNRAQAKYGDIVWYYTMNNQQRYRMPNETEMNTLYSNANVRAAFCYTDKGTIVYGAYFTSNNGELRVQDFPVGTKAYHKYSNVTALVRANKGLFLPITGYRMTGSNKMIYRDMAWGGDAYGQYMTSTSNWPDYALALWFGAKQWKYVGTAKGQASAIRPVWDESSTTGTDPVYPAFQNIK